MKKQYLFLILVIYLIGCIMNLCYYIVIYGTFFSMQYMNAILLLVVAILLIFNYTNNHTYKQYHNKT